MIALIVSNYDSKKLILIKLINIEYI